MVYLCEDLINLTKIYISEKWYFYKNSFLNTIDNDFLIKHVAILIVNKYIFSKDMIKLLINKYYKYEKCNLLYSALYDADRNRCNKILPIFDGYFIPLYSGMFDLINKDCSQYKIKNMKIIKKSNKNKYIYKNFINILRIRNIRKELIENNKNLYDQYKKECIKERNKIIGSDTYCECKPYSGECYIPGCFSYNEKYLYDCFLEKPKGKYNKMSIYNSEQSIQKPEDIARLKKDQKKEYDNLVKKLDKLGYVPSL